MVDLKPRMAYNDPTVKREEDNMAYPNECFWNSNSPLQPLADELRALIPAEGEVPNKKQNPALERFRKASNCYYDLFNNGLCNRAREFYHVFKITSSHYRQGEWGYNNRLYEVVEPVMEQIVMDAMAEQAVNLLEVA